MSKKPLRGLSEEFELRVKVFSHHYKYTISASLLLMAIGVGVTLIVGINDALQGDKDVSPETARYLEAIDRIKGLDVELTKLRDFLSAEMRHIAETEFTLRELEDEKGKLEPIVKADKETVDAILDAHRRSGQRDRYFDWGVGFVLGVFASMLAAMLMARLQMGAVAKLGEEETPQPKS